MIVQDSSTLKKIIQTDVSCGFTLKWEETPPLCLSRDLGEPKGLSNSKLLAKEFNSFFGKASSFANWKKRSTKELKHHSLT